MKEVSNFEIAVKSKLLKKRLTITELAQQIGISIPYCSDVIRGNRDAQHIRKKICEILEIKQEEK